MSDRGWMLDTEEAHEERVYERDQAVARRIAERVRPETVREALTRSEHACEVCGAKMPAGSVMWFGKSSAKAGRVWFTVYVCCFCPTPMEPVSTVPRSRVERWMELHVKRGRGRPAVELTEPERALVVEFRASGLGELRVARAFRETTGRKVSARTLARFGR